MRLTIAVAALFALGGCTDTPTPASYARTVTAPTDATGKPTKLGLCSGCHGENGLSTLPIYPNLAGQNAPYLVSALRAYQSGARQNSAMQAMVGTLTDAEIETLARYYSSQSFVQPNAVKASP